MSEVRVEDRGKAKALRRLRALQMLALHQSPPTASLVSPERVGNREKGHSPIGAAVQRAKDASNQRMRHERTRGIVDQDKIRFRCAKRLKTISNRVLARGASDHGLPPRKRFRKGVLEQGVLVLADDVLNRADFPVAHEGLRGPGKERAAT